jgi:DNA polymerase-1
VLKREKPTHIAVAFDPSGPTFRHEAYEQYKAQRESTPEDIKLAVPYIKKIIQAYNIPILEVPGYEADDVIGTVSKMAENAGFEVFMLTPDKDLGQLVSDHVFMYRPKHTGGFEVMGPKEIREKYDLDSHDQVIDLLGLMGDSSDNIPGCPGVGEKTAVKLLKEFGSIDTLLTRTAELKGALKTKVEENKDQIIFSRFLATIKTDVPVEFDEKGLELEEPNEDALKELFDELEFRTMTRNKFGAKPFTSLPPDEANTYVSFSPAKAPAGQMSLFDTPDEPEKKQTAPARAAKQFTEPEPVDANELLTLKNVAHSYMLVETKVQRADLISKLFMQKSVCFDTETTGVDPFLADMVGMSFCFVKGEAYYVTLPADRSEVEAVLREFKAFFQAAHIEKIGQNIKFDMLMLWSYGIELKGNLFDTMIAHYLLQPELRHGMDYLAEIYLRYRTIHYEELVGGKGKNQLDIRFVDIDLLKDYAAEDADITFQLKQILAEELKDNGLEKLFYDIEMPLMKVLATIERNGVRIDTEALKLSSEILTAEAIKLKKKFTKWQDTVLMWPRRLRLVKFFSSVLNSMKKQKKPKQDNIQLQKIFWKKLRSKPPIV